jgi:DegV family protein with EDD domain
MNKVAIVTDSTCCLPAELVERYDISLVPLTIAHKGHSYLDGVDISADEVYKIMRTRKELPTTSTPSTGDFLSTYCRLSQKAESIACVTLTSLQSKTYEAALMARESAREIVPDTAIEVVDSRAVAGALGFVTLAAARAADGGADLEQASQAALDMIGRVNHVAIVDTLYYLARTGRIGRAAAWAGSILDMKPIVEHSTAIGETTPVARPRTRPKALKQLLDILGKRIGSSTAHVIVHHADELEEGERLKAEISSRFDCAELYLTEFTPGMGVHAGPGILAASFYTE